MSATKINHNIVGTVYPRGPCPGAGPGLVVVAGGRERDQLLGGAGRQPRQPPHHAGVRRPAQPAQEGEPQP